MLTLNVINGFDPVQPSASDGLDIVMIALSSLVIVPVPLPSRMEALTGFDKVMMTVSFNSTLLSPLTSTVTVCVNAPPAVKLSVPAASG